MTQHVTKHSPDLFGRLVFDKEHNGIDVHFVHLADGGGVHVQHAVSVLQIASRRQHC